MHTVGRGVLIASAAAALVLAGNVVARATDKTASEVHCAGINACKGQGSCAGAANAWGSAKPSHGRPDAADGRRLFVERRTSILRAQPQ